MSCPSERQGKMGWLVGQDWDQKKTFSTLDNSNGAEWIELAAVVAVKMNIHAQV